MARRASQRVIASHGGPSRFVGVQYHPEHTFATAAIIEARQDRMITEGFAQSVEALRSVISDLRMLETEPNRRDMAWKLGVDKQVLDPRLRSAEIGDWLHTSVLPRRAGRAAAAQQSRAAQMPAVKH
jgi:GMP synthase (glutamine-hydrolysing)